MAISWGTAANSVRVGVQWRAPVSPSPGGGQTVTADIYIDSVNIADTSNTLSWTGVGSGSVSGLNLNGSGQRLIHTVSFTGRVGETVTLNVSLAGVEYAGSTRTASQSLWVPYALPAAPATATASRVSDARFDIAWTGTWSASAPATKFYIDRNTDDVVGTMVAGGLGSAVRAWSDTSTQANRKYRWRVFAENSAGTASAVSAYLYTTPAASSRPTWTKTAGGDVALSWTVNATHAAKQWVEDSPDGTTWTKVSPDLSGTATSWTHTAPSTAVTHRYRIVAETPNLLKGTSSASTIVTLLSAPNKPTNLSPNGVAPLGEALALTWTHNPNDGTPQQQRELRHRANSGAAWTTVGPTATSSTSYTLAAGTYTSGSPQWEVRTKGAHVDWSPWSDTATLALSARPVAGFTVPDSSGTWGGSSLPVVGTYHDPEGSPLGAWRLRLKQGAALLAERSGSSLPIASTFTGLAHATTYTVELEVRDGAGLWSAVASRTFAVAYTPPTVPTVDVSFDTNRAEAVVSITNPATGVAVTRNEVYTAQGAYLGEVGPNGTLSWRTPPLDGTAAVFVRAHTDLPSSADTAVVAVPLPSGGLGIHLNAGPGYGLHAALWRGSPSVGWSPDVDVTLTTFAGDILPSSSYGPTEPMTLDLSGRVWFAEPESSRAHWIAVLRAKTTVCYRDCVRTLYGVVTGPGFTETNVRWAAMSATFTETMSDARDLFDFEPVLIEDPPGSGEYRVIAVERDTSILNLLEG